MKKNQHSIILLIAVLLAGLLLGFFLGRSTAPVSNEGLPQSTASIAESSVLSSDEGSTASSSVSSNTAASSTAEELSLLPADTESSQHTSDTESTSSSVQSSAENTQSTGDTSSVGDSEEAFSEEDSWYTESDTTENSEEAWIDEDGSYSSKDEVALYIHTYGHLPDNYLTKQEAEDLGWVASKGNLWKVAPGMSIGGNRFGNYEGLLPEGDRTYYECDIDYNGGNRNAKRIVFSDDGYVFYTNDHYKSFELLYEPGEES